MRPATTPVEELTVVLVQPSEWRDDGATNLRTVLDGLRPLGPLDERHLVVLPELVGSSLDDDAYLAGLRSITDATGAWLIGGSHYSTAPMVNTGLVLDPNGAVADRYEKRNPYGVEHDHGVQPGERHATCHIGGREVAVMICADAWFSELLHTPPTGAEVVVVPSFSITRRPPEFSRALWRHLAVARAYEFTAHVVIADWRLGTTYHGTPCAGVGGVADPAPRDPERYFTPAADATTSAHRLDLAKADELRADRLARRFTRRA